MHLQSKWHQDVFVDLPRVSPLHHAGCMTAYPPCFGHDPYFFYHRGRAYPYACPVHDACSSWSAPRGACYPSVSVHQIPPCPTSVPGLGTTRRMAEMTRRKAHSLALRARCLRSRDRDKILALQPAVVVTMRPLTEDESKAVFSKLANYIVRCPLNSFHLSDRFVFRVKTSSTSLTVQMIPTAFVCKRIVCSTFQNQPCAFQSLLHVQTSSVSEPVLASSAKAASSSCILRPSIILPSTPNIRLVSIFLIWYRLPYIDLDMDKTQWGDAFPLRQSCREGTSWTHN